MSSRPSGCTGECCSEFPINGLKHDQVMNFLDLDINKSSLEHSHISSLLVLLSDGPAGARYTCNRFDVNTKLCLDYANRPKHMCGKYPYNTFCRHCWLTLQQLSGLEIAAGVEL